MKRKVDKTMTSGDGIRYTTKIVGSGRPKVDTRKIYVTRAFLKSCGNPDVGNELFRRALFIGYGPAAIRALFADLSETETAVYYTAETLGFDSQSFEIIVEG